MIISADVKQRPVVVFSSGSYHNSPISVLKWNFSGKRLVTGDNVRFISDFIFVFNLYFFNRGGWLLCGVLTAVATYLSFDSIERKGK
jgi:hypothetical protein